MNLLMFVLPWAYVAPGIPLSLNVQCFIIMNHFMIVIVMISWPGLNPFKGAQVQTLASYLIFSRWLVITGMFSCLFFVSLVKNGSWDSSPHNLVSVHPSSLHLWFPASFNVFHRFIMHHSLEPISSNLFLILIFHFFIFKPSATPDCSFPVR